MHGEVLKNVEDKIARAFGVPVFQDKGLSVKTKRMVYRAVVMGVLLSWGCCSMGQRPG